VAGFLNIGSSALLSLQRAITTTGNNIANVNTEGYNRQRVDFETRPSQLFGSNYIGTGVTAGNVQRFYDQFLVSEVRDRTSSFSGFEIFHQLSTRLDSLLANPSVGLSSSIDNFFAALQNAANNPGSLPERQVLLGEAQALADRFHYLDSNFSSVNDEINARVESSVDNINALAGNIADLNEQVARATARAGGQPPNDLLDARDQLIERLSKIVSVTTVEQSNGALNVIIGKGQPLVVGFTHTQLQTLADPFDSTQKIVGVTGFNGVISDLGRFLKGGELGAVLDFREHVLDPARNKLGLVATGLAATFNDQHRLGLDLNGQPGIDFFKPLEAVLATHSNNTGSASVNASISNAGDLTGDDYSLRFDGGLWSLTNLSSGVVQTGAGPFTLDGLTITVGGAPANGDAFLIQPTLQGAKLFEVALNRPEGFAAAAPLRPQSALNNTGTASLDGLLVSDASSLPLPGQVTLTFDPDALGPGVPGFNVAGIAGGPLAYDAATEANGKTFVLGGFEFVVSGNPQSGDEFSIQNNSGGSGDNRNILALTELQTARELIGGTASYQDTYGRLVAELAVKTRQAESGVSTERVLLAQAVSSRSSVSGVNLDEEAANLIRFQQAYQAAAQIISVANDLFQTLLNATRR